MKKLLLLMLVMATAACFNCGLDEIDLSQEPERDYVTPDYVDNGDGTITDRSVNGLMWKKVSSQCADTPSWNWYTANSTCDDDTTAAYTDWRVPTTKEFQSMLLIPIGTLQSYFTDYTTWDDEFYWTSIAPYETKVDVIRVDTGSIMQFNKASSACIRCVRTIK